MCGGRQLQGLHVGWSDHAIHRQQYAHLLDEVCQTTVEQRWNAALAPFNIEIRYRAEKHNVNADALSRLPQMNMHNADVDSCFEELTQTTRLPATLGINVLEAGVDVDMVGDGANGTPSSVSPADMRTHQETDMILRLLLQYHRLGQRPDATERRGEATLALLAMRDKLIERTASIQPEQPLLSATLRERILRCLHDETEHHGIDRTEAMVREQSYWVILHDDVHQWVIKCGRCAVATMPHIKTSTPLGLITAMRPLQAVCVDFTVLAPSSDVRENVLGIDDVFTMSIGADGQTT